MRALALPHIDLCPCGRPADSSGECRQCREMSASRAWREHEVHVIGQPHIVQKDQALGGERRKKR